MASSTNMPVLLLIDDDPASLHLMYEMLKDDGYEFIVSTTVEDALTTCAKVGPDLVLLDIDMPGANGFDVCAQLKAEPATQDVPVIFVTGRSSPHDEALCFARGGVDFIPKPINQPVLRARISNQLTLVRQQAQLQDLVLIDRLMGIPNRRAFDLHAEKESRACRRKQVPLGVILLDVDCFQAYNDNYGHPTGDQTLREVARVLGGALRRPRDFLARYAGEELACILPFSDLAETTAVAEYLRNQIDAARIPHQASNVKPYVTVSAGVASWIPQGCSDISELLSTAGANLSQAKSGGRNRVTSFAPAPPMANHPGPRG